MGRNRSKVEQATRRSIGPSRCARVLGGLLVGLVAPMSLMVPSAAADDGDVQRRLEVACARVAVASQRLDRAIARLDAPASERGSLAWFEAAIGRATDGNRPRIAADLQQRLARLTERRAQLNVRSTQLDQAAARCAELGVGA